MIDHCNYVTLLNQNVKNSNNHWNIWISIVFKIHFDHFSPLSSLLPWIFKSRSMDGFWSFEPSVRDWTLECSLHFLFEATFYNRNPLYLKSHESSPFFTFYLIRFHAKIVFERRKIISRIFSNPPIFGNYIAFCLWKSPKFCGSCKKNLVFELR